MAVRVGVVVSGGNPRLSTDASGGRDSKVAFGVPWEVSGFVSTVPGEETLESKITT